MARAAPSAGGASMGDRGEDLSAKGLVEQPGLVAHLRCLQDPALRAAASAVVWD